MLNVYTLSGYEGVGKSTIINHFKKENGFAVIPETARLIMPLDETVLKESRDDLSYKSFISYLTNLHFMLSNNMRLDVISDRNLIDSLTYLKLYSTEQSIDLVETGDFIERFLNQYNREFLYNEMFLITHPIDDDYILNNILSDPERRYGHNIEQYKSDSKKWEDIYCETADYLVTRGLAPKLHVIKSYPENPNIIQNVENIVINKPL